MNFFSTVESIVDEDFSSHDAIDVRVSIAPDVSAVDVATNDLK